MNILKRTDGEYKMNLLKRTAKTIDYFIFFKNLLSIVDLLAKHPYSYFS